MSCSSSENVNSMRNTKRFSEAIPKHAEVAQPRSGDISHILSLFVRTFVHLEICYRKQFHKRLKLVRDSIEREPPSLEEKGEASEA